MSEVKTHKIVATAVGRRKLAIASVRLLSGAGEITVNGKPVAQYFPGIVSASKYLAPFKIAGVEGKYSASVKIVGGGPHGQLEAMVLGISRCLVAHKPTLKPSLRAAKLMTRDPRVRQRRMVGMGGKSRRRKQSPKR